MIVMSEDNRKILAYMFNGKSKIHFVRRQFVLISNLTMFRGIIKIFKDLFTESRLHSKNKYFESTTNFTVNAKAHILNPNEISLCF
jgi:hypothetical protein